MKKTKIRRRAAPANKTKNTPPSPTEIPSKSSPQQLAQALNTHFNELFAGPVERIEHYLSVESVTDDNYWAAKKFIHACERVAVWRLMQGELSGDAGHHIQFLAREIVHSIRVMIERGDIMLARWIPPIVEELQQALQVYGSKFTGSVKDRVPIEQLLKRHTARELLAMLAALHPDWHSLLLHIYHPKIQKLPEEKRQHILLRKRRIIESFSEKRLQKLFLSKELFVGREEGKRTEEWRKHGIAALIENVVALREGESENVNLFVEQLWQGRLWGLGPDKITKRGAATFVDCPWKGRRNNPKRSDVSAWMKLVMPFLKKITEDDATRLDVFERMLAARKFVYHDASGMGHGRLANDSSKFIWNQIETEIRKAWQTLAKRMSKLDSKKVA